MGLKLEPIRTRIFSVVANICCLRSHARSRVAFVHGAPIDPRDRATLCSIETERSAQGLGQVVFALPHLTRAVERRLGRNAKPARTHQQLFRVIDDPTRKIYDSPSRARLYGDPSRRVTNVYDAPIWQRYNARYCSTRHART